MNIAVKDMLDGVDPQKGIQAATCLIETKNPLYFIDSLFYRSESYHQIGEYKLAVNDLLKLREVLIAQEKQSKDLQKKQELKGNIAAVTKRLSSNYIILNNDAPQYPQETLHWLKESLKLEPDNPGNYLSLAIYYQQIDQPKKIKENLLIAKKLGVRYGDQALINYVDEELKKLK